MKAIYILAIFCCSFIISEGQTNVYHPFPKDSAVWRVESYIFSSTPSTIAYLKLLGDTTLNNIVYKKLVSISYTVPATGPGSPFNYEYIGGIRQDLILKKVYIVPSIGQYAGVERLFYDFTPKYVGDTIYSVNHLGEVNYQYGIVTGLDSIKIGVNYTTEYKMQANGYPCSSLIEGVGFSDGLFYIQAATVSGSWTRLMCFSLNNVALFGMSCNLNVGVSENEQDKNLISVSPNPSSGLFAFSQLYGENTIEIYDLTGRIVYSSIVNAASKEIDLTTQPKGIYFYNVMNENQISQQGKLILQ